MPSSVPVCRLLLIVGLVAFSVSACGRRGNLEPPPNPAAAPAAQTESEDESDNTLPSPIGTPQKAPKTPYVKPKKPFILDPIL